MRILLCLVLVAASSVSFGASRSEYIKRYSAENVFTKITDTKGNGDARLYGTRNFRVVLHGALYRGGANNHAHRTNPRDNQNPMQEDGLDNLCAEGFSTAIYAYTTRYKTAVSNRSCKSFDGKSNALEYLSLDAFKNNYEIMKLVFDSINDPRRGPVYFHCWNGWHASGFAAATALMQFCGLTGEQAAIYWEGTLDGTAENYQGLIKKIRSFQVYPDLQISSEKQREICPILEKPAARTKR